MNGVPHIEPTGDEEFGVERALALEDA